MKKKRSQRGKKQAKPFKAERRTLTKEVWEKFVLSLRRAPVSKPQQSCCCLQLFTKKKSDEPEEELPEKNREVQ
jgi:hypothetical protein